MAKELSLTNTHVPSCGYTSEEAREVALIIRAQLGTELERMVASYNFISHADEGRGALSFRFKGSKKANYLKVILTAGDLYCLRFAKIGKYDYQVVDFVEDIYCDQLHEVFERVTECATKLPRIRL